jgi:hypothetical protein
MRMGEIKDIWEGVDVDDQREVNISLKNTMMMVDPAIDQMWKTNMKVNVLYGIMFFAVGSGILAACINYFSK